jgi:hypothetical protein
MRGRRSRRLGPPGPNEGRLTSQMRPRRRPRNSHSRMRRARRSSRRAR